MPIQNAITKNVKIFDLTNAVEVAKDNGTITGSPTFSRDGCDLDGSNDYITYAIPNTLMSSEKISIAMEFTPDFAADDNSNRLLCFTPTIGYNLTKAGGNHINITLGNTSIADISLVTYQAYWKVGERNLLTVSSNGSSTDAWLNGNQILTADATAWTPGNPTSLFVGATNIPNQFFDGKIHSVSIKNDLTTAQEALDLYDNSTFNFQNKSDVWLDMKSQVGKESGTELMADSDMEAVGVTSWTAASGAIITKETGARTGGSGTQILQVSVQTSDAFGSANNINGITIGKRYRFRGWAKGDGVNGIPRLLLSNSTELWLGTVSTDWQYFDMVATADFSGVSLGTNGNNATTDISQWDDVSVELVQQTTPDKSGHGNDFLLGGGSDTTKMPAFKNPGFDFDGSADFMSNLSATGKFNDAEQTYTFCFKPDFDDQDGVQHHLSDATNGERVAIYKSSGGNLAAFINGTVVLNAGVSEYGAYWRTHGLNVLVIATSSGDSTMYLNNKIVKTSASAYTPANPSEFYVGQAFNASQWWDGEIFHFSKSPFMYTPTQVRQITSQLLNDYS